MQIYVVIYIFFQFRIPFIIFFLGKTAKHKMTPYTLETQVRTNSMQQFS